MKKETLYCSISDNIGQVKIENAESEIKRMKKSGHGIWVKDITPYIDCYDEWDDDVLNPCPLNDGYCWIVKEEVALNKID